MTIKELQEHVKELRDARGWSDTTPEQRVMWAMTEVGEVMKEVLRLSEATSEAQVFEIKRNLGMEIYDVVWNLCDLANIVDIDLEALFAGKLAANRARRWDQE